MKYMTCIMSGIYFSFSDKFPAITVIKIYYCRQSQYAKLCTSQTISDFDSSKRVNLCHKRNEDLVR